jgi:hypothetical protein
MVNGVGWFAVQLMAEPQHKQSNQPPKRIDDNHNNVLPGFEGRTAANTQQSAERED